MPVVRSVLRIRQPYLPCVDVLPQHITYYDSPPHTPTRSEKKTTPLLEFLYHERSQIWPLLPARSGVCITEAVSDEGRAQQLSGYTNTSSAPVNQALHSLELHAICHPSSIHTSINICARSTEVDREHSWKPTPRVSGGYHLTLNISRTFNTSHVRCAIAHRPGAVRRRTTIPKRMTPKPTRQR